MEKIITITSVLIILLNLSCVHTNVENNFNDEQYNNLVWASKYNLEYSFYFDSSLEFKNKTLVKGSLNEIVKFLKKKDIHDDLLVIILSKGTHFDISNLTQQELALKITKSFDEHFKRVIVRNAYSIDFHGVIFDAEIDKK